MIVKISDLGRRLTHRFETHRAYRQLSALDDRMLKDIGLHRSHIQMIANGIDGTRRKAA